MLHDVICNFFLRIFIYLFLAVLIFTAAQAFISCSKQGLLSSCSAQASHCGGFSCCRAWVLGHAGFSSYGTRAQ